LIPGPIGKNTRQVALTHTRKNSKVQKVLSKSNKCIIAAEATNVDALSYLYKMAEIMPSKCPTQESIQQSRRNVFGTCPIRTL
jgi:hypothetical protein